MRDATPPEQTSRHSRLALWGPRAAVYGLAAIPLVCLVLLVIRYGVDLPYRDEWALVWYIREAYRGSLSLYDLWLPHNEHRMLFPRILLLALARLTGWNVSYELAVNILLATGILALVVHQAGRTRLLLGPDRADFLLPALSLTAYSLKQADNWLMGFQLLFWLNVLAAVSGMIALAMPVFRWWRFLAALFAGVVASYSTANGLLYWLVALPGLLALPLRNRRTKRICQLAWLLVALTTIGSHLHDYHRPPLGRLTTSLIERPLDHIAYVLCYLGNPVGPHHILATCLAGLLGLLTVAVAGLLLVRSRHLTMQALVPYLSLALYSLGTALVTGAGRVHLGPLQAKVSRYVTMATPLWLAVLVLLYLVYRVSVLEGRERGARGRGRRALAGLALAAFVAVVLAVGRSSVKAIPVFRDWHDTLAPARADLLSGASLDFLQETWPDVDMAAERAFLKEHHLSVFRGK